MKKFAWITSALLFLTAVVTPQASAFEPVAAANVFSRLAVAPQLSDPSVALIDVSTGEVVFESNATSQRKPASTMKIFAAVATLKYLDPDQVFATTISLGVETGTLVINGEFDPWISMDHRVATKMNRTSFPRLAFNGLSAAKENNEGELEKLKIYFNDIHNSEVAAFKSFFKKRGVSTTFVRVNDEKAYQLSGAGIVYSTSPTVREIMNYFLLWSDNVLSKKMARLAAKYANNSFNDKGVAKTFSTILTELGIDPAKLVIKDASGLSRENKVTARVLAQLLYKIHSDEKLSLLIEGLPVGGESGTLSKRYLETAPEAVGLVKAKTGTLSGTVSLAGYVQSGDREYAFAIIADKIKRTSTASDQARKTLDRYLAKIASPLLFSIEETTTVTTDLQLL